MNRNNYKIIFVILINIILLRCAGTGLPVLTENIINDQSNFHFKKNERTLKLNKVKEFEFRGSKLNSPFIFMTDFKNNLIVPFDNSAITIIKNSGLFSDVVTEGQMDYDLNMKLIYNWYFAKHTGWAWGNEYGLYLSIEYELKDNNNGFIYKDITRSDYYPSAKDGEKKEWFARSMEYNIRENLNKYLLIKSASNDFCPYKDDLLTNLKKFSNLYFKDNNYNYYDLKALHLAIKGQIEKNDVTKFLKLDDDYFKYLLSFSYIPTEGLNKSRELNLSQLRKSVYSCLDFFKYYDSMNEESVFILNNIVTLSNSIIDNDWKVFFKDDTTFQRLSPKFIYNLPLVIFPQFNENLINYAAGQSFKDIILISIADDYCKLNLLNYLANPNISVEIKKDIFTQILSWYSLISYDDDRKKYYNDVLSNSKFSFEAHEKSIITKIINQCNNSIDTKKMLERFISNDDIDPHLKKMAQEVLNKFQN